MLKKLLFIVMSLLFFTANAHAWYVEIDSSGTYGGTLPSTTFNFNYDVGDSPISLNNVFLALQSSTGAALYSGLPVAVQEHTAGMFSAAVWGSTGVTPLQSGNTIYNISAYNPHATLDYVPLDDGNPLLMTAIWASDPGIVTLTNYNPGVEFVSMRVDGVDMFFGQDIFIYDNGTKIGNIPIPGASLLVAFGMVGLIGLRRIVR